jgi:hypothetical protein
VTINNSPRLSLGARDPQVNLLGFRWPVTAAAVKAELDMATCNAQLDNVLEAKTAGAAGNPITVAVVGDSATGAGVTITRSGTAFTIHFESGVSTQGHVNTAIGALAGADDLIEVKTAGTEATTLVNGRAAMDMGAVFLAPDTQLQAGFATGADGNRYTVKAVADGTGAGSLEVLDMTGVGKILVYHFENGVSTVANFEAAVAALSPADFEVQTAGTPANLWAAGDEACTDMLGSGTDTNAEQAATALAGGTAFGAVTITGDSPWVESVAHTAVGTYLVTLREAFPQMLDAKASFMDGSASAYQAIVGPYSRANRTLYIYVWDTNGAALADPTPAAGTEVGVMLWMGNSGVGICK